MAATMNPLAQYRVDMSVEEILDDKLVAWPLTRAMCAPIGDGALDACLRPQPLRATEPGDLRVLAPRVARDPSDLLDRHVDAVATGEGELQEVAVVARATAPAEHPFVACDAVIDVDDEVSWREPLEDVAGHDPPHGLRPTNADGPEQLPVGDEDEPIGTTLESAVEAALDDDDRHRSTASGSWPDRAGGNCGSCQPKRSPELSPRPAIVPGASDSQVSSSVREARSRAFQSLRTR